MTHILTYRDERTQALALEIGKKMVSVMNDKDVLLLIEPMSKTFAAHSKAACRKLVHEIFIWIYENKPDLRDAAGLRVTLLRYYIVLVFVL